MIIGRNGINLIKKFEGFRDKAYQDQAGVWTIGYGHTKAVKDGDMITANQAEELLREDLKVAEDDVYSCVFASINNNQFDALCSLAYNEGGTKVKKSTLIRQLNAGNYLIAANEFSKWVYVGGQIDPGLVRRRATEKLLFLTPLDEAFDI